MHLIAFPILATIFQFLALLIYPSANSADLTLSGPLAENKYKVRFSGIDASNGSLSAYGGVIVAPRGLDGPSMALRLVAGSWLGHDFSANSAITGSNPSFERSSSDADLQIGYRTIANGWYGGAYLGARWRHQSARDGGQSTRHGALGLKADIELSHHPSPALPLYIDVRASYSTVANGYWSRVQPGLRNGAITLGPELALLGEDGYGQWRAGAFVNVAVPDSNWHVSLSGGWAAYHRPSQGVNDSAYGSLGVARTF